MLSIALTIYLLIGIGLVTFGPANENIRRDVTRVWRSSLFRELHGGHGMPRRKLLAYRFLLALGIALVWPLFLVSILKENAAARNHSSYSRKRSAKRGIRFQRMVGQGTVVCADCGYAELVTSFTQAKAVEGEGAFTTGYQCLDCGKFRAIKSAGPARDGAGPHCDCGGMLSRTHVLFCPKCRSIALAYRLQSIT